MTSNATNALFDVNFWVALVLTHHTHNVPAVAALRALPAPVFCRVTQSGLLRMLTTAPVMGANTCDAAMAWSVYEKIARDTRATFLNEPAGLERQWKEFMIAGGSTAGNAWTDAYLAAFAVSAGLEMVTFDRGFRRFKGLHCRIL